MFGRAIGYRVAGSRSPFLSLYDGHLVRRRWGWQASSRNVRWVLLAGGGERRGSLCQALLAFFRLSVPKTPFSPNLAYHADPAFFLIHSLVIGARHFPLFPLSFQARSDRLATHSNRRHQVAAGRPNDLRRHGPSAWRSSFRTKNPDFFQIFLREVSAFATVSRLSDWTISRCVRRGTTPGRPQIANSDS
jgi:hypothetical protein